MPLTEFIIDIVFSLLQCVNVPHFFLSSKAFLKQVLLKSDFTNCSYEVRAKTKTPDTYHINIDYVNVIRFGKITSNSTQNRQKTHQAQKGKKLIFQKNR